VRSAQVRRADAPGVALAARLWPAVPGATFDLPAASLGDRHGGPIPTDPADPNGLRARVPVFLLDADVPALPAASIGGRGWMKLELPPQPLGLQWLARWRQLLIRHFDPTGSA
jgi:putative peptide zinc metalloprotease protein